MWNHNLRVLSVLFCQIFTIALLSGTVILEKSALSNRMNYLHDNARLMEKFRNKFHELQRTSASDSTLEFKLVDGFVNHMEAIDMSVREAETEYHHLSLVICLGLIFVNILAFMSLLMPSRIQSNKNG